jgi:hypothetical protein
MRLYLDDVRPTPVGFDLRAYTADEAMDFLWSGKVTHISLDHDLGDETDKTGYDVARYIEGAAYENLIPRLTWEIHSQNPVGRDNMIMALRSAERFWDEHE